MPFSNSSWIKSRQTQTKPRPSEGCSCTTSPKTKNRPNNGVSIARCDRLLKQTFVWKKGWSVIVFFVSVIFTYCLFFLAMDLKNAKVYEGAPDGKPNTTMTISDEDFVLLAEGKMNPQTAFMKGKLKITGNIMLAQKLAPLLKANAKL